MKWASTIATEPTLGAATKQAAEQIYRGLNQQQPDLVLAFVSGAHAAELDELGTLLKGEFDSALVFGCCASGVIGGGKEIEEGTALSLTCGILPGVTLAGTHLMQADAPPVYAERHLWEDRLRCRVADDPSLLILADPFTFETENFLLGLDRAFPNAPKIGGLASGGRQAGGTTLYLGDKVYRSGVIALAMTGNVVLQTALAQGSRPIGDPMFVTAAHDNLIRELDGRTPRDALSAIYERLNPADRRLFGDSLFLGIAMAAGRTEYRPGEFLVRSILGLDPQSGALWVAGNVATKSVVQLHVRDAVTAAQDLELTLKQVKASANSRARAALLFACVSRGVQLYGHPDHDSDTFRRLVADVPLGGFFSGGEIGPVQSTTYLHGHTSAFGMLAPRR